MAGNIKIPDINLIVLSGRLTKDPDVRYTTTGRPVAKIRVANSRRFRNASSGEWQEEATFIDVTVWGEAAERVKNRLKKGSPVLVEGRLQSEEWEAKDGTKRTSIKITARRVQFLESLSDDANAEVASSGSETDSPSAPPSFTEKTQEGEVNLEKTGIPL